MDNLDDEDLAKDINLLLYVSSAHPCKVESEMLFQR